MFIALIDQEHASQSLPTIPSRVVGRPLLSSNLGGELLLWAAIKGHFRFIRRRASASPVTSLIQTLPVGAQQTKPPPYAASTHTNFND